MKHFKCGTFDGKNLDYLCLSEKDGEDLATYVRKEWLEKSKENTGVGEIIDYDVEDDEYEEHLIESLNRDVMVKVPNGSFDFMTKEKS